MSSDTAELNSAVIADLLRVHYELQKGLFISSWDEGSNWLRVRSEVTPVAMWNHLAWLSPGCAGPMTGFLEVLTKEKDSEDRPCLYLVSEALGKGDLTAAAVDAGFIEHEREAWMCYRGRGITLVDNPASSVSIRLAQSALEMADFATIFAAAYRARATQYHRAFSTGQAQLVPGRVCRHYVGYADGQPAVAGSLLSLGHYACIYNIGTSPQFQGKGLAAALVRHLIAESHAFECRTLFLQAEKQSRAERLYARLGFEISFERVGYRFGAQVKRKRSPRRFEADAEAGARDGHLASICTRASTGTRPSYAEVEVSLQQDGKRFALDSQGRIHPASNCLWVAAWAALLSRYSGAGQVSFGVELETQAQTLLANFECDESVPIQTWCSSVEKKLKDLQSESVPLASAPAEFETVLRLGTEQAQVADSGGGRPVLICWVDPLIRSCIRFRFDQTRLQEESVRRLAAHYWTLLCSFASSPNSPLRQAEMLTRKESEELLVHWSNCSARSVEYRPVHRLFETQAAESPAAPAVRMGPGAGNGEDDFLTYGCLNARANQLANRLHNLGVRRDRIVGICLEPSLNLIVAVLAVFKAGGVCLPLDPGLPRERLHFILSDAQPVLIIGSSKGENRSNTPLLANVPQIVVDDIETIRCSTDNLSLASPPESAAYIIYTSGSTGQPKGVLVSYRALAKHCLDTRMYYGLGASDKVLQFNSISFDAAFEQIVTTLISGALLVLRGPDVWTVRQFKERSEACALTVVDLPTSYWHQLLSEWVRDRALLPAALPRLWIVGGEAMTPESLQLWRQLPVEAIRLINAYGPTETTITATAFDVTREFLSSELPRRIPIGRPRGERSVYVLDKWMRPVPAGVLGELFIGGPLLANGYLNRPELTGERFVSNPFSAEPQDRLYRTGDQVRFLPSGELEFAGRSDHQVKIRGYRVELEEIQAALQEHPDVRDCCVLLSPRKSSEPILLAYYVAQTGAATSDALLREYLRKRLPSYMVPSAFVPLKLLPVLPSGKIDRQALLAIPAERPEPVSLTSPRTPAELGIQLVFERVLQREGISVDASFFELGGDSLQALELVVELERQWGRTLPLELLYQAPTIEGLARQLEEGQTSNQRSSLILLQAGDERPPLFLVHTTPGDILGYGNLLHHLDRDQPCFGFQSLGLVRPESIHQRVEEMAAYYVHLLRGVHPEGPYFLAGWCYGGIVAVEMAQQLGAKEIGFLGLLETVAPPPGSSLPEYYRHRLGCLLRMHPSEWLTYAKKKWQYRRDVKMADRMRFRRLEKSQADDTRGVEEHNRRLEQLERVYTANMEALKQYRPRFYPGKVTLFNAAVQDAGVIRDPLCGWPGLAAEIEVHTVPGDHDSMLSEPNVAILAEKFQASLNEAQRRFADRDAQPHERHSRKLEPAATL